MGATTALLPGLAGWALAMATAAADVTLPDGRELPTAEEEAMLTGIGVIYPDRSLGGTAFLVGRCDVLVTARHTVFDAADQPRADRFLYYPLNGDRAIEVPLEGSIVGSGSEEQDDWIVMRLAEPDTGCRPMIAWAVTDGDLLAVADEGFDNAGFHADLRAELRVSHGCTIAPACRAAAEDSDVFTHDCDTDVGASGSPIYVAAPDGIAVFGMHIRGHGHGADICSQSNLALRISGAFHAAIRELLTAEVLAGPRRHH